MSATAILNILVGVAIGGWFVFGGLAGKLADAVGADGSGGGSKAVANVEQPTATGGGGLVLV